MRQTIHETRATPVGVLNGIEEHRRRSPFRHELFATVDVVGRAGERRVSHQMHGECSDIGRLDTRPMGSVARS